MQYKDVKARCLFCEAMVEANQRDMAGRWDSPDDLSPQWRCNEEPGRRWLWLWYGAGNPDVHQDFYLCPEHNDPDHFHTAMKWADDHLRSREFIDFTDLQELPPPLTVVERWKEPSLVLQVPDLGEVKCHEKLPNAWQAEDRRLEGSALVAWALDDVEKLSNSWDIVELLELNEHPKPLELAKALKTVARNIELLTMSEEPGSAKQKAN